jgi:hypothetical protein
VIFVQTIAEKMLEIAGTALGGGDDIDATHVLMGADDKCVTISLLLQPWQRLQQLAHQFFPPVNKE